MSRRPTDKSLSCFTKTFKPYVFSFFEYCRSRHTTSSGEIPISIIDFLEQGWEIETQKGNPEINTNYLLSILITDSQVKTAGSSVQSSERNARYDGIITFGNNLTMVIENKPRSGNVWFGQLNPSRQNLGDDTIVYSKPAVLEWKEIIKQLNHLLTVPTISGYEKIMIEDFLSYIDEKFPHLNPYDGFRQCKRNKELLIGISHMASCPRPAWTLFCNFGHFRPAS